MQKLILLYLHWCATHVQNKVVDPTAYTTVSLSLAQYQRSGLAQITLVSVAFHVDKMS